MILRACEWKQTLVSSKLRKVSIIFFVCTGDIVEPREAPTISSTANLFDFTEKALLHQSPVCSPQAAGEAGGGVGGGGGGISRRDVYLDITDFHRPSQELALVLDKSERDEDSLIRKVAVFQI